MLILCFAALFAMVVVARVPDASGHYTDPTWIVAAMSVVMMVLLFYATLWLCRMFQALERLLLILTGVDPGEAQFTLQATLKRLQKLIKELTT